ncbi:MAG: hypothetical protein KME59_07830 [Trichormus sp. ATA11-4-KO1]|jgi:hypothetical protein|nr:hypothetical protein [Trichormus sp. ATA11-4-KO1]
MLNNWLLASTSLAAISSDFRGEQNLHQTNYLRLITPKTPADDVCMRVLLA